ncbi:MAG: nuclear transport factor 2 family protein [Anaeromyxobacteraceae bacterium]
MSTATSPAHSFQAAFAARDFDAMRELVHPDVVLNSPILSKPFEGREAVLELFEVITATLEDVRFTVDIGEGDIHFFSFHARVGSTEMQGADIVRVGEDGRIAEFTIFFRPLPGLAVLAAALGKGLAGRKSRARGRFAGAASAPLVALSRATDRIAPRLVK